MNGEGSVTQRRAARDRRPPKNRWELTSSTAAGEGDWVDEDQVMAHSGGGDDDEEVFSNGAESDDGSELFAEADMDVSDSEDEYRPEAKSKHQGPRPSQSQSGSTGRGLSAAMQDESDEEFGDDSASEGLLSDGRHESDGDAQDDTIDPALRSAAAHASAARRRRKKTRAPPTSRLPGGLEGLDSWQMLAQEKRQRQALSRTDAGSAENIEVEEEELQGLAEAFTGVNTNISTETVGQWQKALHADRDFDEELDEVGFEQDLRGAAGFRRRKVRDEHGRVRRGPHEQVLSPEVKQLLAEANLAFVSDDTQGTIKKMAEVIRIEPAIRSAWSTMALCYAESGDERRALQCRIMEAHLTPHATNLWVQIAQKSEALGYDEQRLYCLSKAISSSQEKDRSDVLDIMWEKAHLLLEMDEGRRAAQTFLRMLRYRPQNQHIVRKAIIVLVNVDMQDKAIDVLEKCAEVNMQMFPDPRTAYPDEEEGLSGNTYETSEMVTMADLLLQRDRPKDAIDVLRKGQRWLQGRLAETFWDDLPDDREYDTEDMRMDREGDYGRQVNLAESYDLDPEFRIRLGTARARLGEIYEAERHFDLWREGADLADHLEHYGDIVDAYIRMAADLEDDEDGDQIAKKLYDKALGIAVDLHGERLRYLEETNEANEDYTQDLNTYTAECKRLGTCYLGLEDHKSALNYWNEVVQYSPDDLESRLKLAEVYGALNNHQKAVELIREVMQIRREAQHVNEYHGGQGGEGSNEASVDGEGEMMTQSLSLFAEISEREARNRGKKRSTTAGTREEALRLEAMNEADATQVYNRAKPLESKIFVDRWWHPDCPLAGDPTVRIYGVQESSSKRKERFKHVAEWLGNIERLVNMFTDTPQLYLRDKTKKYSGLFRRRRRRGDQVDRQARALLESIGRSMIDERILARDLEKTTFRGIPLDEWINLLMQYSFVLTKLGEFEDAKWVLMRALRSSVVCTDLERTQSLNLCLASCAMYAGRWDVVVSEWALRSLPAKSQFQIEPLRILGVVGCGGGRAGHRALSFPQNLKFFLRRSRIHDSLVQQCPAIFNFATRRWIAKAKMFEKSVNDDGNDDGDEDDEEEEDDDDDGGMGGIGAGNITEETMQDEEEAEAEAEEEGEQEQRRSYRHSSLSGDDHPALPPQAKKRRRKSKGANSETKAQKAGPVLFKTKEADPQTVWSSMQDAVQRGLVMDLSENQYRPPRRYNPANDMFYAGLLLTSSNGIPSMAYWLRAFAQFQNDALVCLACAIACLGRATNRQVDNRHQAVVEAFAFLSRYRSIRQLERKSASSVRSIATANEKNDAEVEYNFGRASHHVGLSQMAVQHYKTVLQAANEKTADGEPHPSEPLPSNEAAENAASGYTQPSSFDCVAEAAFSLHLIYITSGNPALANAVVKRHLRV